MIHRLTCLTGVTTLAAAAAAVSLAGCGSIDTPPPPPSPIPTFTVPTPPVPGVSPASLARTLNAKGIDCSGFALSNRSDIDPGASAEGHCGSGAIIEIAALPSRSAFAPFVANLRSFTNCSSSSAIKVYVDGGTWAMYSTDDATTAQIARALGTHTTPVC